MDSRDNPDSIELGETGEFVIDTMIPAPLLTPGVYYVSAVIGQPPKGRIDAREAVVMFEITDLDTTRPSRPGSIFLPTPWRRISP